MFHLIFAMGDVVPDTFLFLGRVELLELIYVALLLLRAEGSFSELILDTLDLDGPVTAWAAPRPHGNWRHG